MIKTTIGLLVIAILALPGGQLVYARGCGGMHPSTGSHPTSSSHSGSYHAGSSSAEAYHAPGGTTAVHSSEGTAVHSSEGTAVKGPKGDTYTHEASPGQHPTSGASRTDYHGSGDTTAVHGAEGTAVKGPEGNVYAHPAASGSTYHATGYSAAHTALPTDAGYGVSAAAAGPAAYAASHQTAPVNPNVAAATGAAVRNSYNGYGAKPATWSAAGWTAGQAWGVPTWSAVGTSLGYAADVQPFAYNYGSNIAYQGNQVYYDGQPTATADQYYQQASTLAQNAPPADLQTTDWISLGVFALVQKEQSDPHYVLQLAVNKSGTLGGGYSDLVSGTTLPIQGAVDKASQRVAWTVGNNKNTVGETGLYNLTQDEAPALIHIGKDKTQQWLLVRLKQPAQQGDK